MFKVWYLVGMQKILELQTGSKMYNLQTPTSDDDRSVVFIESLEDVLFSKHEGSHKVGDETDVTTYSLRRFMKLGASGNFNIIIPLFQHFNLNPLYVDDLGNELVNARTMFLSKKMTNSVLGMTSSSFHNIERYQQGTYRASVEDNYKKLLKDLTSSYLALTLSRLILRDGYWDHAWYGSQENKIAYNIKTGKFFLAEIKYILTNARQEFEGTVSRSNLVDEPDMLKINELTKQLHLKSWGFS